MALLASVIAPFFSFSVYSYFWVSLKLCSVLYYPLLCLCNIFNACKSHWICQLFYLCLSVYLSSMFISLTMSLPLMCLPLAHLSSFFQVLSHSRLFVCVSLPWFFRVAGLLSMGFYLLMNRQSSSVPIGKPFTWFDFQF